MTDPDPEIVPEPANSEVDDLSTVRELILAANADVVPELVQGDSVTALVASIEPAREAYTRIAASMPKTVTVPAGGNTPVTIDADALPTAEKIRRGLASNRP